MIACDLPGLPGHYVRPSGRVTGTPEHADAYASAEHDAPTRPVPRGDGSAMLPPAPSGADVARWYALAAIPGALRAALGCNT